MDQDKVFFSHEFLTKFIQEYQKYPSLWDPNVKEYVNNMERQKSWEQLLVFCEAELGSVDLEWLKRKVHSMKGSFNKELKKMKEARRAGFTGEWQPKLWYFENLLFTKTHELRKHWSVKSEVEEDVSQTGSVLQTGDRYGEEELNGWAGHLLEEETNSTADEEKEIASYPEGKDAVPSSRKRRASPSTNHIGSKRRRPLETVQEELGKPDVGDVYDAVGKVVASKLRALSDLDYTQFIRADKLINDALYRGFQKQLTEDCEVTVDRQPVYPNYPTMTSTSNPASHLSSPPFPHHTYNYYFPLNSPLAPVPFQPPSSSTTNTPSKTGAPSNNPSHQPVLGNRSPTQITCEVDVVPHCNS